MNPDGSKIFTVYELTRTIKNLIEPPLRSIMVEGEVSRPKPSSGGHLYFTLKDQKAVLPCVLFASDRLMWGKYIKDGAKVLLHGRINLWEPSGRYQMIVDRVQPTGIGELLLKLKELREKLAKEGLFDPSKKRPLPFIPRKIGVVTSLYGAGLKDILKTAWSRYPAHFVVYPAKVQGEGAAQSIARGIFALSGISGIDVIIIGRGGGSFEDLFAFNEEILVRAVAGSTIPIVSAVGHEIDTVLTDLAADVRAKTPTEAGGIVVPDKIEQLSKIDELKQTLATSLQHFVDNSELRLDNAYRILHDSFYRFLNQRENLINRMSVILERQNPINKLQTWENQIVQYRMRLLIGIRNHISSKEELLKRIEVRIKGVDPFAPLKRGYSLISTSEGRLLRSVDDVNVGDSVTARLYKGTFQAKITDKSSD